MGGHNWIFYRAKAVGHCAYDLPDPLDKLTCVGSGHSVSLHFLEVFGLKCKIFSVGECLLYVL